MAEPAFYRCADSAACPSRDECRLAMPPTTAGDGAMLAAWNARRHRQEDRCDGFLPINP